jgi:hypothetical protein
MTCHSFRPLEARGFVARVYAWFTRNIRFWHATE